MKKSAHKRRMTRHRRQKQIRRNVSLVVLSALLLLIIILRGINENGDHSDRISVAASPVPVTSVPISPSPTPIPDSSASVPASSQNTIDLSDYPESLIDFMNKYPEATSFVLDYPQKKDNHPVIDLSEEVTQGQIPLFLQWDERWGYETYGDDLLGITGCGPTCLSMVYCGLTGKSNWNPFQVALMAEEANFYVDGVGSSWDLMQSGARSLGLNVREISLNADSIKGALISGIPIICSVTSGDFTYSGHFIVLTGVDENGDITLNDPNSRNNSMKSWDIYDLLPQISGLWGYTYDAEK